MNLVYTAAGVLLILLGMYDIFRTLLLPSGRGLISKWIAHGIWRGARLTASEGQGLLSLAGPLAFISSVLTWGALLTFGFALVYWPYMPDAFSYSPGLVPELNDGFLDAVYLSLVTGATLGFGDITPQHSWLRLVVPAQALIGFVLWTAAISLLLSIYPNLARRQAFAHEVSLLQSAESSTGVDLTSLENPDAAVRALSKITADLVAIRGDLQQFPITYYFHESERASSLPAVMPYVLDIARRAGQPGSAPEVRLEAARLRDALEAFTGTLATRFLYIEHESVEQVLAAYAHDNAWSA